MVLEKLWVPEARSDEGSEGRVHVMLLFNYIYMVVPEGRGAPEALSDAGSAGRKGRAYVILAIFLGIWGYHLSR